MSDLDRYQYGYDQNSNRLWKANVVGTAAVPAGLDEGYSYDNLNRLTQMQRGVLSSGVITGTPSREMDYTLDPTGNWSAYLTKTSGTTDLNQSRTQNTVNEITAIGGTPGWATPPSYDAAGNMTSFPQPANPSSAYTAVYDAWNRMVSVSASGSTVAQYQYDGTGRRTVKQTYSSGTLSETRHFYYTNNWQDIEERLGTSTSMDKQFVRGIRYIDELVCRDDATPERLYATQDANFNVTSLINTSGAVEQRFVYDPYGSATVLTAAWAGTTDDYAWTRRFTGQFFDTETQLYYYRARYYHPQFGTFMSRDPQDYVDSPNLYEYTSSNPEINLDPQGTSTTRQSCWDYWLKQEEDELTANHGLSAAQQLVNVIKGCIGDLEEKEGWAKHMAECIAKNGFNLPILDLFQNVACCIANDYIDPVKLEQERGGNDSSVCQPSCEFQSCQRLFDPSTYSINGAIKSGEAYRDCLCACGG